MFTPAGGMFSGRSRCYPTEEHIRAVGRAARVHDGPRNHLFPYANTHHVLVLISFVVSPVVVEIPLRLCSFFFVR